MIPSGGLCLLWCRDFGLGLGILISTFCVDFVGLSSMVEVVALPPFRRKRRAKCIKAQEGRFRYVLGHDIFMERVSSLCSRTLVRRLE